MKPDESKLSHPASYVYLTNNGLWKNRLNQGAVPSVSCWKKMLHWPCILTCL